MARYIDANILKEKILEERDKIPLKRVERYSFGVETPYRDGQAMRGGIRKALRCLEQTPTADVVPKSEVERLEEKCAILNEKNAQLALALFRDFPTTKELEVWEACEAVKTKVAREIFEEIEKAIEKCKYNQSTPFGIEERYNPYAIIKQVDKLKKKYTETDNGTTNSNM